MMPQYTPNPGHKSIAQRNNLQNLRDNTAKGVLSSKSASKLKNAINWLVSASPTKRIYHKSTKSTYQFKLNFITLTLPTLDHSISDFKFKNTLLHNFLNTCKYKFGLKNYVWKVECQKNGNIHAHITTDTFIHHVELRKTWNRILKKNSLLDAYTTKHSALSFAEYNSMYNSKGLIDQYKMRNAFVQGKSANWCNPNSTDVKAVHKISDIAAYLIKYMSKSEEGRRLVSGRLWGCSYNLSAANSLTVEIAPNSSIDYTSCLMSKDIDYKPIEVIDKLSGQPRKVGELFLYNLKDWGTKLTGNILAVFQEHLFRIKNDLNVLALRDYSYEELNQPVSVEIFDNVLIPIHSNNLSNSGHAMQISCPF